MTDRLVAYSLALLTDPPRPDLLWQLETSLATLRQHNGRIPVVVFVHGPLVPPVIEICRTHDVMLHPCGPYEATLAELSAGWPALARLPLLHKFLNFPDLAAPGARRVLYCDCDTVFFGDVARLFDGYPRGDVVAREEVHTGRSQFGPDPRFVDEALLARIAAREGARVIAPFNTGVVLFNDGVARRLAAIGPRFVDYAWRFVCWMTQHPATGAAAAYGELETVTCARQLVTPADLARALPFPSINRWLVEEAALWLALGHVPGLRTADFSRGDVAQNGEVLHADPATAPWLVCHYFSQNRSRIHAWLERRPHPTTV